MDYWHIILLLAINCWHESPSEPVNGQIAVAQVLIGRSQYCGSSVEHELFRPYQFSWANNKKVNTVLEQRNHADHEKFARCLSVAALALSAPNLISDAKYYHADYIEKKKWPKWAKKMNKVAHIGRHIFYSGDFPCTDEKASAPEVETGTEILASGVFGYLSVDMNSAMSDVIKNAAISLASSSSALMVKADDEVNSWSSAANESNANSQAEEKESERSRGPPGE